ncbi:glycoside hydrolase family 6 protein [Catenulispora subtropica]|uniref:Glucanase n=1 Tax=Catenulispora subtropica TaxID=450798 RepID=A0ABP5CTT9_9ACTN
MLPRTIGLLLAAGLTTTAVTTVGAATTASASAEAAAAPVGHTLPPDTRFSVTPDNEAARQALADLKQGDPTDAVTMAKLATWPEATWFTGGTPDQVRSQVRSTVRIAEAQHAVPVLVAYDIPLRDCSQYSAGGAPSDAAYQQWISAFAQGVGDSHAVVIVEPDALANLPSDCSPTTDPTGALTAGRIADVNAAVTALEARPQTVVYLDAGNSQWHSVGDMANRLLQAGVARTQGFFLNVSNYQPTDQTDRYGTWISKCMWFATAGPDWARGHADWCASQYYSSAAPNDGLPGDAVSATDPSTWHWTDAWFDQNVGTPPAAQLSHFVVDTSRNGLGAWTPPPGEYSGDPQTWCNPPGRGIGARPTAATGVALADAYLYIKTIGESDGGCTRGTAGPGDPEYGGTVDPAAGAWWPAQALTLADNAVPALTFNTGLRP